jgi:hypothetical protein
MAGNENSGGFRPTAPQNNTGVNALGGNGSADGVPSIDYTGFAYGQNQQLNQSRIAGNQAVASTKAAGVTTSQSPYEGISMPQLGTLTDPTNNPAEPITAGVDFGPGPGSEALPKGFGNNTRPDENQQIVKNYLPDLAFAAQSKDAPDSFKRFVNFLMEQ